jgi:hypothetical protein
LGEKSAPNDQLLPFWGCRSLLPPVICRPVMVVPSWQVVAPAVQPGTLARVG